eukprot:2943657-Rhodomonas_salina.1
MCPPPPSARGQTRRGERAQPLPGAGEEERMDIASDAAEGEDRLPAVATAGALRAGVVRLLRSPTAGVPIRGPGVGERREG